MSVLNCGVEHCSGVSQGEAHTDGHLDFFALHILLIRVSKFGTQSPTYAFYIITSVRVMAIFDTCRINCSRAKRLITECLHATPALIRIIKCEYLPNLFPPPYICHATEVAVPRQRPRQKHPDCRMCGTIVHLHVYAHCLH